MSSLDGFMADMPPDLQAEAMALRRRQAVLDALLKQGVPYGPKTQAELAAAERNIAERYQAGLQGAVQDYSNKRQGGIFNRMIGPEDTGTNWSGSLDEQDIPRREVPVPGDRRGAAVQALTSGYKPLAAIGQKDLEALKGNEMTAEDFLKLPNFDPKNLVAAARLTAQGVPLEKVVELLGQGGKSLPEGWEAQIPAGVKRGPIAGQYYAGDDLMELVYDRGVFKGSKKLDNAPKVVTHTTVNQTGPKAGAQEYFKQAAKTVDELGDRARAAQDVSTGVALLANRDAQGVFSNVTSGAASFMTNLAQVAGVDVPPDQLAKLGNTEVYNALSIEMWQNLVAKFGGNRGVTKEEAEQIKQILPQTRSSPQARQELYRILEHLAQKQISRFRVSNAAFVKALNSDDPTIWGQHISETLLPTTPFMPATAPERPTKPVGNLRPAR